MKVGDSISIVSGSSGLIGSAVCRRLEEVGYRTFGFDRPGLPHPPEMTEAVDFDLTNDDSVSDALTRLASHAGHRISSVVHLAAYYDFSGEPSDLYEKVTVRGTRRFLAALQRMGFLVEQFLFSSTMLVHAPAEPGQRINEDSPLKATWPYPESKIRTEALLREEHGAIPVALLRLAGVYDDHCHSIPIAHQIQRIYERDFTSHLFPGDTDAGQSFVHLDDAVEAIRLCVEKRAQLPTVLPLLIGEEDVVSYRDLQNQIGQLVHGHEWHTVRIPKVVAKAGAFVQEKLPGADPFIKPWMIDRADDHYAPVITRARRLLGWEPKRSLRDTLPAMIAALRADPDGWYRENKLQGSPPAREPAHSSAEA